jgi:hypothetical protein
MHIPKTSGTSLSAALRKAIRPRTAVTGFDRSTFGAFTAFHTFDPQLQRSFHQEAVPAADFVSGHLAFSTLTANAGDAQLVTVLREPRSRLVSNWLFWRTRPEADLRSWGEWRGAIRQARAPLGTFLSARAVASVVDNVAVRMLLWPHPLVPEDAFIDPRDDGLLLETALDRLHRFAFVDVVENPSLRGNLQAWLGRTLTYPRLNQTTAVPELLRSPLAEELTTEATRLLEHRSRLDRVLWSELAERLIASTPPDVLYARSFGETSRRYAGMMATM